MLHKIHRRGIIFAAALFLYSLSSSLGLAESRGYRNHNPGNIIKTDIRWQGEVDCVDRKFECFHSDVLGIRAISLVLNSYYTKHGLRSTYEIINRYVGEDDRSKSAYVQYVMGSTISGCFRRYTNVVSDYVKAIIIFENGYIKKDVDINKVVEEALPNMINKEWRC